MDSPARPLASPEAQYAQSLQQGQFCIQRCEACAKAVFYPRMLCPHCGCDRLAWIKPAGWGVVYATTCVRRKKEMGGDYNVAIVELDEGPRMMSRVDCVNPAEVQVGLRVRAAVVNTGETALVVFHPEVAQ